jgi:hypothetical protein
MKMFERSGMGMSYTDTATGRSIWKAGFHHTEASLKAEVMKLKPLPKAARKAAPVAKSNADLDALFEELA